MPNPAPPPAYAAYRPACARNTSRPSAAGVEPPTNGPSSRHSRPPAKPPPARSVATSLTARCRVHSTAATAMATPIARNASSATSRWPSASSIEPIRTTSRPTTLIANTIPASSSTRSHRLIIRPPPLVRLLAADELRLGIVTPGELLSLDLLPVPVEHPPDVLGEPGDAHGVDAGGPRLDVLALGLGDIPPVAPLGRDLVPHLGAPQRHSDPGLVVRGVDHHPVLGVVAELHIKRRIEDRSLNHRRVAGVVVRVGRVLDILQPGVERRVEQRGGELRQPAADRRLQPAVQDHRRVLEPLLVAAGAAELVQREHLAGQHQRAVDHVREQGDV